MGHIRKRGENSWEITVSAGTDPITGKRKRIYENVTGTKTEAKKRMREIEYKLEHGTYVEPSNLTLEEFLLQWLEDYCEHNLAPSTLETYEIIVKTHVIPILGSIKMANLKAMHIKRYLSHKLKDGRKDGKKGGLSKKTVKRHYTTLNTALNHAVKWEMLENNPADKISPPKGEKSEIEALTKKQLYKLLEVAEGWIYDFIYIAAFTGMRRGELLALRWKDVDFENQKLQVKQSVTRPANKGLVFRKPKTDSSIRPIDVDEDVIKILKRRNKEQKENRLKFGSEYNNEYNLVFCREDGTPFNPRYATRSFNKVAKKVDLEEFRLHDLRHTHATLMLKAGIHPKIVQERLGHASITQTLDTYSHVIPSMQKEAVQKLKNSLK
ncbi:site-specific integrase [Natroniella acetigena]|uniref:tyrosine-type recombinase/integrase n=1 Tax=Natroniella acetigena TaxID=52004 RepID=UPI00200B595B|nr:site-specific integrase [Natroniella acetigena]MCK8826354.1 site-specific integrase [Natroniella acetigena]